MRDLEKHPWALGNLRITRATLDRVDEDARRGFALDEESCGLLVGPAADPLLVDDAIPMPNRANALHRLDPEAYPRTGRTYFDIDSMKFEGALRRGEGQGRPVKVLYHSHVEAGAYFSPTDAEVARMGQSEPPWDLAYLVTSIVGGRIDDRKLFIWAPQTATFVASRFDVLEG